MKNWRTTLVGCLFAVIVAIEPLITTGAMNWEQVGKAALIALFAFLVKDANVTGGTVAANNEAKERVEPKI